MLGGTQNHLACRECQQTVEQWKQVLIVSQKFVGLGCERSHWGLFITSSVLVVIAVYNRSGNSK
jgi:hypothetical protein